MWELVIYMGISWAGIGSGSYSGMPDKETCMEVLRELKSTQDIGKNISVESGYKVIAFCRPYSIKNQK